MNVDELPLSRLRVLRVRDESVLLDSDLAALYGVETKAFNQAIKRNAHRFPRDFAFQLAEEEWAGLRSQSVTLAAGGQGRHRKYLPWVFTEHGAIMAAAILNSERAVAMSTYVVRAFMRLRRELLGNATLEVRLTKIEKELLSHDAALRTLFAKIKPLLVPPPELPEKRWVSTLSSKNHNADARHLRHLLPHCDCHGKQSSRQPALRLSTPPRHGTFDGGPSSVRAVPLCVATHLDSHRPRQNRR